MKFIIASVLTIVLPCSVTAQDLIMPVFHVDHPPTRVERLNQGLLLGSVSASSMALGLTMACTSGGTCREINPVMRRLIGDGTVRAVVFKAGLTGIAHYAVWQGTNGKTRTLTLAALAVLNTLDAVHDIRQTRRIQ